MKNFKKIDKMCLFLLVVFGMLFFLNSQARAEGFLDGWKGDVFAGYNKSSGNTDKATGSLAAQAVKDFDGAQLIFKGNILYSESNNKMDGQKWDVLAKYFYDFGEGDRWFNFYQVAVDHDYFADIDYRISPAFGVGYHISRTEEWTWDVDAGLGYRITRHRLNKAADDESPTALLHTFMKRKVLENAFISEDLTVSPGLKSGNGVVVRSELVFTNPLNESLDLEIKYIVDHDSEPAEGKKKTDTQIIMGIKYKF